MLYTNLLGLFMLSIVYALADYFLAVTLWHAPDHIICGQTKLIKYFDQEGQIPAVN